MRIWTFARSALSAVFIIKWLLHYLASDIPACILRIWLTLFTPCDTHTDLPSLMLCRSFSCSHTYWYMWKSHASIQHVCPVIKNYGALSCDVCCPLGTILDESTLVQLPPFQYWVVEMVKSTLQNKPCPSWPPWTTRRGGVTQPEGLETRTSQGSASAACLAYSTQNFNYNIHKLFIYLTLQVNRMSAVLRWHTTLNFQGQQTWNPSWQNSLSL